jgi:hypothetical protein
MRTLPLLATLAALIGCAEQPAPSAEVEPVSDADPAWVQHDVAEHFSFGAPPNLGVEQVRGVDSAVGAFASDAMKLSYDFGWYSNPLPDEGQEGFTAETVEIDGHAARLVQYRHAPVDPARPNVVAVHFPDLGEGNRLTVVALCADDETIAVAQEIMRSIRFR